uniref:Uncharacterized protein n=1 Tax=Arundo donax TaxID=35708 RepID=A0A0A8Y9L8_ARUDO
MPFNARNHTPGPKFSCNNSTSITSVHIYFNSTKLLLHLYGCIYYSNSLYTFQLLP